MSRTKRLHYGAPTDGPRKADYYATPAWATRALLSRWWPTDGARSVWHGPLQVYDPGAGDGAILREVHAYNVMDRHQRPDASLAALRGMDVRQAAVDECRGQGFAVDLGDFLTDSAPMHPGVEIICNPPYGGRDNLAQRFVSRALQIQQPGGWVWMLLRLMWINDGQSTHKRVTWLRETVGMPRVLALPRRPSFTGKGNDATTYAWFGWRAGERLSVGTFGILSEGSEG